MKAFVGYALVLSTVLSCNSIERLRGKKPPAADSAAAAGSAAFEPVTVPPPKTPKVLDLAVGQWTRHTITESNGNRSSLTYKVIAKEGGAYWLEVVTGAPNAGAVIQILLELKERYKPENSQILAARVKMPKGFVKDIRGPMLDASKEAYKKALRQVFVPDLAAMQKETVTVPAGKFEQCYRHTETTSFAGMEVSSTLWQHPAVPITALVKSVSVDGGTTVELVAFGTVGARSSM
jgi:hypothetical protein